MLFQILQTAIELIEWGCLEATCW